MGLSKIINSKYGVKNPWERNLRNYTKQKQEKLQNDLSLSGNQDIYD